MTVSFEQYQSLRDIAQIDILGEVGKSWERPTDWIACRQTYGGLWTLYNLESISLHYILISHETIALETFIMSKNLKVQKN